jgi:hypothetical protein
LAGLGVRFFQEAFMTTKSGFNNLRRAALTTAALGIYLPAIALAQVNAMPDLPHGPAKPGFDIMRFSPTPKGMFETFYVNETNPLRKVLEEGKVAADTRVLVTTTAGGRLALLIDQMTYHHLAQGRARNKDWMATF